MAQLETVAAERQSAVAALQTALQEAREETAASKAAAAEAAADAEAARTAALHRAQVTCTIPCIRTDSNALASFAPGIVGVGLLFRAVALDVSTCPLCTQSQAGFQSKHRLQLLARCNCLTQSARFCINVPRRFFPPACTVLARRLRCAR